MHGGDLHESVIVIDDHSSHDSFPMPDGVDHLVLMHDARSIEVFASSCFGLLCITGSHMLEFLRPVVVVIS